MEDIDAVCSDNSDHEINEVQHSSLLDAVSQLDIKQRVKPPSRKESSFQVSEFHLGKNDANRHAVLIRNLTKSLGQQGSHAVITKQLRSIHRKAKTLPRPLEKPVAARIQRSVGFRNAKIQLGRWDAVVYSNRVADQLSFPLKQSTVSFQTTNDFISKLKSQTRTPLEQQMDEILNNSPAVQEERKEEEEYQLSLAEMRERRREMAKLRAQQSYMASKASRQKKIKSKKYHRILRRERIRQQLKDFEVLQKTDPEAALQQLEQLERTRAEERMSLRHRSTGQWARNKAVRAKYDEESRQELAQQLAVSRELTQKIQVESSSDEEVEEENCENRIPTNNDNPWIAPKTTSEVDEFVSEYRKYWEERNKKSSVETSSTNEIAAHNKVEDVREVGSDVRKGHTQNHETAPGDKNIKEEDLMGSCSLESVNTTDKNNEDICIDTDIPVKEGQKCTDAVYNSTETPAAQHSTFEEVSSTEGQSERKPNEENDTAEWINNSTEILSKEERLSPKKLKSTGEELNSNTLAAAFARSQRVARFGNVLLRNETLFIRPSVQRPVILKQQLTGLGVHLRLLSTRSEAAASPDPESDYHTIIKDTEKGTGSSDKHEFQAETRMLLDIVAKSLYSEKEVFVRELISNASDALEKLRYLRLTGKVCEESDARPLEIHIATDKQKRMLTIQDTGVGMTKEDLVSNLGTIARSGSKAFLEQLKTSGASEDSSSIIGQFGVGFYSSFMVADSVEVFTKSSQVEDSPGFRWSSDGTGTYEIQEAEGVQPGTKIVLHLKQENREFSDEDTVSGIIKKYSNFVGSPIFLNGKQANTIQPLWLMDAKDVTPEMHDEFYRFIGTSYDRPRFTLHYKTDAPLSLRALLYFPEGKPGLFELSRDTETGVSLYSRKVLIKNKTDNILPKWLRFVKGVVDSEDIPLNLSRELLQNSALIRKLRTVLTNRVLRFLHDKSTKDPAEFDKFYKDYGMFLKEGIVTTNEQFEKEEIAKLLRFESSRCGEGDKVTLPQYRSRLAAGQRDIFYLAAPSRTLAESSPYFEALKQKDVEVLFCYEPYDELVLMQLRQFDSHNLTSVEKEMRQDKESDDLTDLGADSLKRSEVEALVPWVKKTLAGMVQNVRVTKRLDAHPCVVTVEEMAAARHFIRTQSHLMNSESRYALLQPQLELNPRHPIIKKLSTLTTTNAKLAELVTKQLFANAMLSAGLVDDPRTLLTSMNELLTLALEKH